MSSHVPSGDRGSRGVPPLDGPPRGAPPPDTPPSDTPPPDTPTGQAAPIAATSRPPQRTAADRADRRAPSTRRRIEAKLSSRTQLQDAFLLYEVLGPPVSLREPGSGPSAG